MLLLHVDLIFVIKFTQTVGKMNIMEFIEMLQHKQSFLYHKICEVVMLNNILVCFLFIFSKYFVVTSY